MAVHAALCPAREVERTNPCTPSKEEAELLREEIIAALALHQEFLLAQAAEADSRNALRRIPQDSPDREPALKSWDDNHSRVEQARARAESAMGAAARKVQQSYGILPPKEGKVANGPFAGAEIAWDLAVQVDRENAIRQEVAPDGRDRYLRFPKDTNSDERVAGITQDDGKVFLGIAAFEDALKHGPGVLALAIHHERVHYDQLTTTGWGTRAKNEAEAYAADLTALKDIDIPPSAWRNKFFRAMAWNSVRAGELLISAKTPAPFTPDSEDAKNRAEFDGPLAEIRKEQENLAFEIQSRAQERRNREAADRIEREYRERSEALRRQEEERAETAYRARLILETWVQASCRYDGLPAPLTAAQVTQAYMDLAVASPLENLWEGPYYTGIPCTDLLMNFLMRDRLEGRLFRDWNEWYDLSGLANVRSRSGPPAAAPSDGQTAPPAPPPEGGTDPGRSSPRPSVPWCLQEPGRRCIH